MQFRTALLAEACGRAFLLIAIVGSGAMGQALCGGNMAVALLANSLATAGALYALIVAFGPISGAHFNPVVTLAAAFEGTLTAPVAAAYVVAQVVGAITGTVIANAMFQLPIFGPSTHARSGPAQMLSEVVATCGLLMIIRLGSRARPESTPSAVACWVLGAYWFTSSTAFGNPAVTIARALTESFAGIRPADAPAFIVAQLAGAALAVVATTNWARRRGRRSESIE